MIFHDTNWPKQHVHVIFRQAYRNQDTPFLSGMSNTNMKRRVPMMQMRVAGAKLSIEYNWLQGAESLLFWGGFIAMQASRADPCTSLNE